MTEETKREQTLLEAAKAAMDAHANGVSYGEWLEACDRLRAAIAREEAYPSTDARIDYEHGRATFWQLKATEANDRAQQAEADAAWHKAESARLSADLALLRAAVSIERSKALESSQWRERAEKAEAELNRVGKQLARLVELQVNPPIAVMQPFESDPQTCAFGSNAFRGNREVAEPAEDDDDPVDPVTGWTFDTYRRVVEALGGKS